MPTDIRNFFGSSSKKPRTNAKKRSIEEPQDVKPVKKIKSRAKSIVVLDDDDDDDDEFIPDKNEKDESSDIEDAFSSEDDLEIIESEKKTPIKRKSPKSTPKKSPKKTPKKNATPSTQSKTPTKPEPKAETESSDTPTPDEVLASIPDCELPEVDETQKVNFWAKKSQLDEQPSDESFRMPEGRPQCLLGLTMVFTGVLPHINREDCENLAKKYGAKVTKSVSGKTNVVVLGADAGASKIKKIKALKTKHIDEAGFIQLIEAMPKASGHYAEAAQKKMAEEEAKIIKMAEEEVKEAELIDKKRKSEIKNSFAQDDYVKPKDRPDSEKLWTVKYAPSRLNQICGNKGQVQKIIKWLNNWDQNKRNKFKYFGESFPAILISGPPGIGKTTAAHIIAKELGYDVIEKNASDVRSKNLLNQTIREILDNTSVVSFFDKNSNSKDNHKICLIMDEVDGMSSGDMGGIGALSTFCRKTSIPIILICNDKSLPKMRTFDRVTLDVPFRRPDATAIKSRILTIALREKIKIPPEIVERLVAYTKNDIRQIINLLSMVSKTCKELNSNNYEELIKNWEKNIAMKSFDITGKFLNSGIWSKSSNVGINEKIQYYFEDHSFVPLMIHENYMQTQPAKAHGSKLEHLRLVVKAADSLSESDIVDSKIHSSEQQWSLMPLHAVMSTLRPSSFVNGSVTGRVNFTSFLGNNSKRNKYERLVTDLNYHMKLATLTNKYELRMNYLNVLSSKLSAPLLQRGADGVQDVINLMDQYYLTRDNWNSLLDLNVGANNKFKLDVVNKQLTSQVKAAFTRKYNGSSHPTAILQVGTSGVSKGGISSEKPDLEDAIDDDTNVIAADNDEPEQDDSIEKDSMIKMKKPAAKKKATSRKKK